VLGTPARADDTGYAAIPEPPQSLNCIAAAASIINKEEPSCGGACGGGACAGGGGSAGSWQYGGCCGRARAVGAGAWRGWLARRSVLRASLVQRARPVWAGRAGPVLSRSGAEPVGPARAQYGPYTVSLTSRATRWLRAGGAPCGRLARKPRCRATGGDARYGLYTASLTSRATRWLRAGGAPCGRLAQKPRSNHVSVLVTFTFQPCSAFLSYLIWGPRAGADGSPQELTPLGLVGVSLWRPLWVGTPPLEPAHDRTVGRVHCPPWLRWSPRVMVSGPLPAPGLALGDKMVARPAPCGRG